jgi:hypothetical protein
MVGTVKNSRAVKRVRLLTAALDHTKRSNHASGGFYALFRRQRQQRRSHSAIPQPVCCLFPTVGSRQAATLQGCH